MPFCSYKIKICFLLLFVLYLVVFCAYFEINFHKKHEYSFFFGKKPLISVLVTSYNYEKYLPKTLDSILVQTYKKYEVIIVDDGSKDNSVELIKKYTAKYPNFYLYQHEGGVNKGLPASVKFGIEKCKGEYVAFLESDDYWHKDKLEEVVKMINKYPEAVIISNNVNILYEKVGPAPELIYPLYQNKLLKEKNKVKNVADFSCTVATMSAVVVKTDVLKSLIFDTPIPAFLDLWIYKQIFAKYPLFYIDEKLTIWRRHPGSFNDYQGKLDKHKKDKDLFIRELKKVLEKSSL